MLEGSALSSKILQVKGAPSRDISTQMIFEMIQNSCMLVRLRCGNTLFRLEGMNKLFFLL
jgi:hypothetical protein